MNTNTEIQTFETADLVGESAAKFIIDQARIAIGERGRFSIVLSGGSTPEKLYNLLASPVLRDQVEWNNIFVFWGDERCLPMDNPENNAFMAKQLLLNKTGMPPDNIFPIPVNLTPAGAARAYEQSIKTFFKNEAPVFDCILLGMGSDGHTASLFPDTAVLHEKAHLVKELYVEKVQMFRVTMTAGLINQARTIVFLITGKEKAEMLATVLTAPFEPDKYPAQLIKSTNGKTYWFLDKEAASLLQS